MSADLTGGVLAEESNNFSEPKKVLFCSLNRKGHSQKRGQLIKVLLLRWLWRAEIRRNRLETNLEIVPRGALRRGVYLYWCFVL